MKPVYWRRLLLGLAVLSVVYAVYRFTLHLMIAAKLDAIRRQGDPVTLDELNDSYPSVAADQNAANIYAQAFGVLYDKPGRNEANILPVVGSANPSSSVGEANPLFGSREHGD